MYTYIHVYKGLARAGVRPRPDADHGHQPPGCQGPVIQILLMILNRIIILMLIHSTTNTITNNTNCN